MSTILLFIMDLDGLFQCKLAHICRVQMVITLPETRQDAPSSQFDDTWKIFSKENSECSSNPGTNREGKSSFKRPLLFLPLTSLFHVSFLFIGENLVEHIDMTISKKSETTTQFQGLICF